MYAGAQELSRALNNEPFSQVSALTKSGLEDAFAHWLAHVIEPQRTAALLPPGMVGGVKDKQTTIHLHRGKIYKSLLYQKLMTINMKKFTAVNNLPIPSDSSLGTKHFTPVNRIAYMSGKSTLLKVIHLRFSYWRPRPVRWCPRVAHWSPAGDVD